MSVAMIAGSGYRGIARGTSTTRPTIRYAEYIAFPPQETATPTMAAVYGRRTCSRPGLDGIMPYAGTFRRDLHACRARMRYGRHGLFPCRPYRSVTVCRYRPPRSPEGESSPRRATGGSSTSRTRIAVRSDAGERSAVSSAVRESERGARASTWAGGRRRARAS